MTRIDLTAKFPPETSRQPVSTGRSLNQLFSKPKYHNAQSIDPAPAEQASAKATSHKAHIRNYLLALLEELQYVEQLPRFHPEGDALYHSIQVYQCAVRETKDPELLAAALFHDVGKAIDYPQHDQVGADAIEGVLSSRITWLVRHHLDLLIRPQKTRRVLAGKQKLTELEQLRRWDLAGRRLDVSVMSPQQALDQLFVDFPAIGCSVPPQD